MKKHYDYLIVGSGLFGATFAHQLTSAGKSCLVVEQRSHIGGNIYTEEIEGINVHKYGAHIFHTSDKEVWKYVNHFVEFNRYTNSPIANYRGKLYNLPFNMNTFNQMWGVISPDQAAAVIEEQRNEAKQIMKENGHSEPQNLEEQALILVGRDIYEKLIKGYTEKQWGRPCTDLPAFIIKRLPVRFIFDNNYFNDTYQGIPIGGYNKLIEQMLSQSDIIMNTNFLDHREELRPLADKVLYTGSLDSYFNYQFGRLEYRTVRFEQENIDIPNFQGNAVVNYTDSQPAYTRIIEHKHFEMFGQAVYDNPHTIISREYSMEWKPNMEPYYPINNERNNKLYAAYLELAKKENNLLLGGRLAEYKYYDMAPTIKNALALAKSELDQCF